MPLVIEKDAYDTWLRGRPEEASKVSAVTPDLVTMAVSKYVNNVRHDDERCIAPLVE
jgi:putative SOS response-associated peptidase YedK